MSKLLNLTKKLISLPSWVGESNNEQKIGEYLYSYLRKNTILEVTKQELGNGRFNIIAKDPSPTKLLLVGHIDTVETRSGWLTNPLTPIVKGNRLYGLGSSDMKGSLAAMLTSVIQSQNTNGLMVLLYCDEEYDFAGMRAFTQLYKDKIAPKLIVSLDGSLGQINYGCRGLIEVSFKFRGRSGHAGAPELGTNAITLGISCINQLGALLESDYRDKTLGATSLNLAYCQGGLDTGLGYGKEGNNIPDIAEFVLDIRPSAPTLNSEVVKKLLTEFGEAVGLKLESWTVRHDLGAWLTPTTKLVPIFGNKGTFVPSSGYIDLQMLWQTFNQIPCCTIGAGIDGQEHTANEYVTISGLKKTAGLVLSLIKNQIGEK